VLLLTLGTATRAQVRQVYIILFNAKTQNEGIHVIDRDDKNTVLMFAFQTDAARYVSELNRLARLNRQSQVPVPTVEAINLGEVLAFCRVSQYTCEQVPENSQISPPEDLSKTHPGSLDMA
jgi:hypothetical protein